MRTLSVLICAALATATLDVRSTYAHVYVSRCEVTHAPRSNPGASSYLMEFDDTARTHDIDGARTQTFLVITDGEDAHVTFYRVTAAYAYGDYQWVYGDTPVAHFAARFVRKNYLPPGDARNEVPPPVEMMTTRNDAGQVARDACGIPE